MGYIYYNSAPSESTLPYSYAVQPLRTRVQPVTTNNDFWKQIFLNSRNGQKLIERFASGDSAWWKNILYSRALTPQQKLEYIFGIKLSELFPGSQLLGDVFEWLNNLFSNQNLSNVELWLRQGQNTANQFANALNIVRNSPNNSNLSLEQQRMQDLLSRGVTTGYNFWQQWGWAVAGGLLLILVLKK